MDPALLSRYIHESQQPVLPVVRPSSRGNLSPGPRSNMNDSGRAEVEWLTTTGVGMARPYFDNLDDTVPDLEPIIETSYNTRRRSSTTAPKIPTLPRRETVRNVRIYYYLKLSIMYVAKRQLNLTMP